MFFPHLLIALLWLLYGLLHSALATTVVKQYFQKRMGKAFRHYRLLYTVFAFITLAALILYQLRVPSPRLLPTSGFLQATGALVTAAGAFIMGICIRNYFLSLSGLKSLYQPEDRPELIIKGIHRHVRHPLYLGTFLFIWGLFLLLPTLSFLLADVVITGYTLAAIDWEERKLVRLFGERYLAYKRNVPRILPRLHRNS